MSIREPLRVAFVGCGGIAGPYATSLADHPDKVAIAGAFDVVAERSQGFVAQYGGPAFSSLDDLVSCPEVDAVLNLTSHTAHAEGTRRALEAGKHVHSEKPLAGSREDASALVELAEQQGLLLGCSPFVILGEAQQTLWKAVRDGMIGEPIEAVGYIMHSRIEKGIPTADAFLAPGAGPLLDVGCYPLNVLTSIFGPVARVRGAAADILIPERVFGVGPRTGESFRVTTPDHVTSLLQYASGMPGRLAASFSVGACTMPGIEVYGTEGSLSMSNPFLFNAEVRFRSNDETEWKLLPFVADPFNGVDWARGLVDLSDALACGTRLHCTGRQAAHILDICLTILDAAESGRAMEVQSTFDPVEVVLA
ncbi:MAG: Gfo/Idh/MocA family oxidoreductase [Armatimonadetes bacterium]|nr:Gfo/Idh/MocA family oxidoreductase [Armatimonadota bacterium]NCO91279.1 Gfo/Idh/MocA family oxidoreductase [Armatimonadota bacterium]NDK11039.1 Gfo/Idh/MocA family oxidoreductase [Armatimonadota bacterium]PIX37206.1 MAG: hypothetical protein COZ57_35595 [Armatimonadetes bacterium CG_4_8_14_3_um_filter_66_20]